MNYFNKVFADKTRISNSRLIITTDDEFTLSTKLIHASSYFKYDYKDFLNHLETEKTLILDKHKERVASTRFSAIRNCVIKATLKEVEDAVYSVISFTDEITIDDMGIKGVIVRAKDRETFRQAVVGLKSLKKEMYYLPKEKEAKFLTNEDNEESKEELKQYSTKTIESIFESMELLKNPPARPKNWGKFGSESAILRLNPTAHLAKNTERFASQNKVTKHNGNYASVNGYRKKSNREYRK